MSKKITVIGSMNMDLVFQVQENPQRGETVFGTGFAMVPGGKGANQAVAVGKLGGSCIFAGCCGEDAFGAELLRSLQAANVDTANVRSLPGYSGVAGIVVEGGGDNRIIVAGGANNSVSSEMMDDLASIIRDSAILLLQLEIPLPAVERAVEIARAAGVTVVLDPAPACALPESLLARVDYLLPNEGELEKMTEGYNLASTDARIGKLLEIGVGHIVITKGSEGCEIHSGSGVRSYPAYKVNAVDTTAAGDTFAGAFCCKLAEGSAEKEAVQYATAAAALSVTRLGAQTSIPGKTEVEHFIAEQQGGNQ